MPKWWNVDHREDRDRQQEHSDGSM
jgi:hypothetical protein